MNLTCSLTELPEGRGTVSPLLQHDPHDTNETPPASSIRASPECDYPPYLPLLPTFPPILPARAFTPSPSVNDQ